MSRADGDDRRGQRVTICDECAARHTAERWNLRCRVGNEAHFRVATGRNGRDGARFGYGAAIGARPAAYPRVTSDDAHPPTMPVPSRVHRPPTGVTCSDEEENNVRRARSLKLIAGLAAAGLALAACSSGTSSSTSSSAATSAAASSAASSAAASAKPSAGGSSGAAVSAAADDRRSGVGQARPGLRHRRPRRPVVQRPGRRGLDKAKAAGVTVDGELTAAQGEPDSAKADRLNQLIDSGATDIIAVGFAYAAR